MKLSNIKKLATVLMTTVIVLVIASCSSTKNTAGEGDDFGDLSAFKVEKSGATLWGENCSRCHNAPDPTAFSDVQWEAIGTHMRIRGGLTASDARKIITFLQQSN